MIEGAIFVPLFIKGVKFKNDFIESLFLHSTNKKRVLKPRTLKSKQSLQGTLDINFKCIQHLLLLIHELSLAHAH